MIRMNRESSKEWLGNIILDASEGRLSFDSLLTELEDLYNNLEE